jgi:predicted methyltransferase
MARLEKLAHAPVLVAALSTGLVASAVAQLDTGEQNVNPGINERFVSPDLDTQQAAAGFESDTREVFTRRRDVMRALGITPGMTVADVGAGSGFYVELMAEAVGREGRVYAVEIAPNWIELLEQKVKDEGLSQVTVVEGTATSVELPADSVDLVFSSDTYHHFEFPQTTLDSIFGALRSGGRWVVLDYDRIPGVTPPGRMDHLRLGRAEAIAEIEAAGFVLESEPDIGLVDNYLAIFRRP